VLSRFTATQTRKKGKGFRIGGAVQAGEPMTAPDDERQSLRELPFIVVSLHSFKRLDYPCQVAR
jgi:hypothetical protein